MKTADLNLYVFSPGGLSSPLGLVEGITGLIWQELFSDAGTFELWCSLNNNNLTLLQRNNLLWIGLDSLGVVEIRELSHNEEGLILHIKGRLAESYLDYRTIFPVFTGSGNLGKVLRDLVFNNMVDPEDQNRRIGDVSISSDPGQDNLGPIISYQQTGGSLLTEVSNLCQAYSLGFRLKFISPLIKEKFPHLAFTLYQGTNRGINQNLVNPIIFSSDLDDILDSTYLDNFSEVRNKAYVAGEDSGVNRVVVGTGDLEARDIDLRELFIDARDLQSTQSQGEAIPESEYKKMLGERGNTKLENYKAIETFEASLRNSSSLEHQFGVDFFLGDTVTIYDSRMRVQIDAVVTSVIYTYDEKGLNVDLVFGYEQPTLANKLRRRI